jgi:peptide/nickel transport system permease protein
MAEAGLKLAAIDGEVSRARPTTRPRVRALLRRLLHVRKHGLGALGAVGVATVVLVALLAPVLAPRDPNAQDLANVLQHPSA